MCSKEIKQLCYDPFEKDIAMVEIIYHKSTLVHIGSQLTLTWIDYFAAVGGLMGLVLGMGFVSFIERTWNFALIILKLYLNYE